jgi:non-canonical purine NTP pyrophosphatase, rdgB/HAM1 family
MNKIIFATGNENKLKEIRQIMQDMDVEIISMKEASINIEIEETGTTFLENSYLKAKTIWDITGGIVMADDSGLVIDYLNGEPGLYSARYMGENTSYDIKNANILGRMKAAKGNERSARFIASIVCILPNGKELSVVETMEGIIADKVAGENGFGYDPILYLPDYDCTSAELSDNEKNKISHRGKALRLMREKLKNENLSC